MKLIRAVGKRVGEKEYYKHSVNIPNRVIEVLGWRHGYDVRWKVKTYGSAEMLLILH
jgi:hypothetical protein